jgi:rhamnosyltransferase
VDRVSPGQRPDSGSVASVVAVVVTFHPDIDRLRSVLAALQGQTEGLVVVDNASGNRSLLRGLLPPGVVWIPNDRNVGLAAGLNQGFARARERFRPDWILAVDQDTILFPGYTRRLLEAIADRPDRDRVGIVSGYESEPAPREAGRIRESRYLYTSGSLIRAALFPAARFREEFFVDQVDLDFCFQVRRAGFRLLSLRERLKDHPLGRARRILGRDLPYEPPERFASMVRNSTVLLREGRLGLSQYVASLSLFGLQLGLEDGFLRAVRAFLEGWRAAVEWPRARPIPPPGT